MFRTRSWLALKMVEEYEDALVLDILDINTRTQPH